MSKSYLEEINYYRKDVIFDRYTQIKFDEWKGYEKISRKKMITDIIDVYKDYHNIIEICTIRELKYLKLILDQDKTCKDEKYFFERTNLQEKCLIIYDLNSFVVPDELIDSVTKAINNYDEKEKQKSDEINEFILGFMKVHGTALLTAVTSITGSLFKIDLDKMNKYILTNRMIRFYVFIDYNANNNYGIPELIFNKYYGYYEQIDENRKKNLIKTVGPKDLRILNSIFYNDYDINNKVVKKFFDYGNKNYNSFKYDIKEKFLKASLLHTDKKSLHKEIQNMYFYKYKDLTELFKLMDKAYDEMPSGALNGLSAKEAKEFLKKNKETKEIKVNNQKQVNAHLSKEDEDMFYDSYFALLEFTNRKYKIRDMKIYHQLYLRPESLIPIIDKLWENKNTIDEFVKTNPYDFSKEQLNIIKKFKKGFKDLFFFVKYEKDYTIICNKDKAYYIKGLKDNIDKVMPANKIPFAAQLVIMPFKNVIIYDGLIRELSVSFSDHTKEFILNTYKTLPKIKEL